MLSAGQVKKEQSFLHRRQEKTGILQEKQKKNTEFSAREAGIKEEGFSAVEV